MKIQPNPEWWISLAIGTYILGATGSWLWLILLGVITAVQGLLTYRAYLRMHR